MMLILRIIAIFAVALNLFISYLTDKSEQMKTPFQRFILYTKVTAEVCAMMFCIVA